MGLLEEIQTALMEPKAELAPIFLKLRLLAARLGSVPLEEWVKHESEGYPEEVEVPPYRKITVDYVGTFFGPFNSQIMNAPIPRATIEKHAGVRWTNYEYRESISALDSLLRNSDGDGQFHVQASNLMLLLQGKVYEDYGCNSVTGQVASSALASIQHIVRNRILELTINLEKSVTGATDISLGSRSTAVAASADQVSQITQQVVYGNVTNISNSGAGASFSIAIKQGDEASLVEALVTGGIRSDDAAEFGKIVASEQPESKTEPFGAKAKAWLGENLKKAANGTWKIGMSVATEVLKEAALRYYGLK